MLRYITQFEIKFRLKRISTWVYFGIFFFLAFFSVSVRQFGPGSIGGKALVNGPFAIAQVISQLTAFGIVIVAAIFGTSIHRDFEGGTYEIFFTTPLKKHEYIGGRFLGSFLVMLMIYAGLPLGLIVGTFMPWADHARLMPVNLWFTVQPFVLFSVVGGFFAGALFFAVGALTRSIMFVYLQGVVLLAVYLIVLTLITDNPDYLNNYWAALLDPFGLITVDKVTRYWTVVEKNTLTLPFAGVMLWNRLLWGGLGAVAMGVVLRFFPFSAEALTARRRRAAPAADLEPAPAVALKPWVMTVTQRFDGRATWARFRSLTRVRVRAIVRDVPFIAIVFIGLVAVATDGWYAGRLFETPVYPVTYLMTQTVLDDFITFIIVITTLYAGELVWKERGIKFDQIHDSLPTAGWLDFASQFAALASIQFVLLALMVVSGVVLQALQGYYRFELHLYAKEMFLLALPLMLQFAVLALFVQTVLSNKFLGHALVIGWFVAQGVMVRYGFEDFLYKFPSKPGYTYSDMNGFGHFVTPLFWFTMYWTAFAAVLGMLTVVFTRRGTDLDWRSRLKLALARSRFPVNALGVAAVVLFMGIGGYVYYNTHVLNPYINSKTRRTRQARFERQYKQYEHVPQPKITAVELTVDLVPERRSYSARGTYTMRNRSDQAIASIHVLDVERVLRTVSFDRSFTPTLADTTLGYHIYALDVPLKPHESLRMDFTAGYDTRGFRERDPRSVLAYNGTFLNSGFFPTIGYARGAELTDEDERRDEGLAPQADMPLPTDSAARFVNLFTSDADRIAFKATISTSSDQIAIAPGYLQKEWTENGRRFFSYDMGDARIANFYAFLSGRYVVKRDTSRGVTIEVYYDAQHPYNVDRMIQSVKAGLQYYDTNFGPYQFRQFRVLEFPRYQNFAQSFPNTVPYSEGIGFIAHGTREDDLDVPFYVTGHELAHQWWGHQVVGDFAQGSNMLSETLAQYSALMVMEKEVGPSNIRMYLRHELDRYLRGRAGERRKEPPISLVQNEPYVWYYKGSLVMYALKDYIGEERLNAALKRYLERTKDQEGPYTTSLEFVNAMRDATPDSLKSIITDLFETITLFDNRAIEATWRETADKKFLVKLKVSAKKLRADGLGVETEIPINDLVDIGVFSGQGKNQKALFLEKRRITKAGMEFEIVVNERPTRAGIDPYNKLIDRSPEDNTVAVTKASAP